MYQDTYFENRIKSLRNDLEIIQNDFRSNLKPKLLKYEGAPLTRLAVETIQNDIYTFLEKHGLKINVRVSQFQGEIRLYGVNLIDNIVWEVIQ